MSERPLEGQVALVTGATRGIGFHCALAYARAGATVVAIGRTVGGLEELDDEVQRAGGETLLVPLDLTDHEGIDRLGPALAERFGRLDVLLGNAATLGVQTPIAHMASKEWQAVLDVNLNANFRLLRTLDPLLRAAANGTALFMTSNAATKAKAYLSAYAVAKAGLETLVRTYGSETRQTAVTANLIDPGPVRTRLRARYLPGEDASALPGPEAIAECIVDVTMQARKRTGELWRFGAESWTPLPRS